MPNFSNFSYFFWPIKYFTDKGYKEWKADIITSVAAITLALFFPSTIAAYSYVSLIFLFLFSNAFTRLILLCDPEEEKEKGFIKNSIILLKIIASAFIYFAAQNLVFGLYNANILDKILFCVNSQLFCRSYEIGEIDPNKYNIIYSFMLIDSYQEDKSLNFVNKVDTDNKPEIIASVNK